MTDDTAALSELTSFHLSDQLQNEIEDELDYGESKAAWIREACWLRIRDGAHTEDASPAE